MGLGGGVSSSNERISVENGVLLIIRMIMMAAVLCVKLGVDKALLYRFGVRRLESPLPLVSYSDYSLMYTCFKYLDDSLIPLSVPYRFGDVYDASAS